MDMQSEVTDLKVLAKIEEVSLQIANSRRDLAHFSLAGLAVGILTKESHKKITLKLRDVRLNDKNVKSIHKTVIYNY